MAIGVVVVGLDYFMVAMNSRIWGLVIHPLTSADLGSIPFYALWAIAAVTWSLGWPEDASVRVVPQASAWTRRNVAVLALVVAASAAMYGSGVARLLQGAAHAPRSILVLCGGGVSGPIVEEWIFRGVLWNRLRRELSGGAGLAAAIGYGSLIFGLWHNPFEEHPTPLVHMTFGILMGILRWRFDSLLLPAIIHVLGNSLWHFTSP